ncbi:glycosyltransferase family 2 protein [Mucilaginibacter sp. P25]|uniref:glycosyltransferase family 2 protein n=1 Tax=Mucilaginibacter sp. P25 TaxID=3423945 RepID=UPI003D7BB16E
MSEWKQWGSWEISNKFIVIIPAFNAETSIDKAILSVLNQDFEDIGIVIRDDMSTDATDQVVRSLFSIDSSETDFSVKSNKRNVIYVKNKKKYYGAGNTFDSVLKYVSNPNSIVGVVDGDDFLLKSDAISIIYNAYQSDPNKWLIWSQHQSSVRGKLGMEGYSAILPSDEVIYSTRNYWAVSHFRTNKAGLYSLINPLVLNDIFEPGEYMKVAADAALLYPMIEMCGNERCQFIDQSLYHYNDGTPTNDLSLYPEQVEIYSEYIRKQKQYSKLDSNFRF